MIMFCRCYLGIVRELILPDHLWIVMAKLSMDLLLQVQVVDSHTTLGGRGAGSAPSSCDIVSIVEGAVDVSHDIEHPRHADSIVTLALAGAG